jgi:predicted adenylyl cyclase CyaB
MEIEVRAHVRDMDSLKDKLAKLGSEYIGRSNIEDQWFCRKEVDSYECTKMNKVGSFGLRIRLSDDAEPRLCIKTIVTEGDHQIFDEVEAIFIGVDEMRRILSILGFKEFCRLKKERFVYLYDNMEINLEKIEGFGDFVEIEILDSCDFAVNKLSIHKILDQLEIKDEDRLTTSITSEYMHRYAFNQHLDRNENRCD